MSTMSHNQFSSHRCSSQDRSSAKQQRGATAGQRSAVAGEHGAVTVEGALSAGVFLIVLVGGLELCIASYQVIGLQYLSSYLSRWATTALQPLPDPESPSQKLDRTRSLELRATQLAETYFLTLGRERFYGGNSGNLENVRICQDSNPGCTTDDKVVANETFTITVREPVRILGYRFFIESEDIFRVGNFIS
ncbi:pilus assembly protein [bacterium]|nr:pilus assembly protein [bacterium]